MAKKQTLTQIETSLARWKTRLRRAVTMIDKLERQQKRLVKAQGKPPVAGLLPVKTLLTKLDDLAVAPPLAKKVVRVEDEIPAFLRRQSPDPIAEQIKKEQAATKLAKSRGRIATMKAKQSGETRRMPLTGKAALAAIRG